MDFVDRILRSLLGALGGAMVANSLWVVPTAVAVGGGLVISAILLLVLRLVLVVLSIFAE